MSLDLHSKVRIISIEKAVLASDHVEIRIVYRVKHGRKDYKMWALPSDFRGTGVFPLRYVRLSKYADVYSANDELVFTGSHSDCRKFVRLANEHYENGS